MEAVPLIRTIILVSMISFSDAYCPAYNQILGVTSDGVNNCDVVGKEEDGTFFWYKCYRIKKDGTFLTYLHQELKTYDTNTKHNLLKHLSFMSEVRNGNGVIDIFVPHTEPYTDNNIAVIAEKRENRGFCVSYHPDSVQKICDEFKRFLSQLLGFDMFRTSNGTFYSVEGYFFGQHVTLIVKPTTGNAQPFRTNSSDVTSISSIGNGSIAIFQNEVMDVYWLEKLDFTENELHDIHLDRRYIGSLTGCPQILCFEGTIDSIYSKGESIYITRNNHLYKIDKYGDDIEKNKPLKSKTSQNEYDCDTSFVVDVTDGKSRQTVFCVQNHKRLLVKITPDDKIHWTKARKVYFKEIPESENIFASFRFELFNEELKKHLNHYYIFAGSKIYHYHHNETHKDTLNYIDSMDTKKRFYSLWSDFDAAWKDPKEDVVYFFKQDYHGSFNWNADQNKVLKLRKQTTLNMNSFWTCKPVNTNRDIKQNLTQSELEKMWEKIRRFRKQPDLWLDYYDIFPTTSSATFPQTNGTKTPMRSRKSLEWIIPVSVVLGIIVIGIILTLAIIWCKPKFKKSKNKKVKKPVKPKSSATSITYQPTLTSASTLKSQSTMSQKGSTVASK